MFRRQFEEAEENRHTGIKQMLFGAIGGLEYAENNEEYAGRNSIGKRQ